MWGVDRRKIFDLYENTVKFLSTYHVRINSSPSETLNLLLIQVPPGANSQASEQDAGE